MSPYQCEAQYSNGGLTGEGTADAVDFVLFANAGAPRRPPKSLWPCDVIGTRVPVVNWVSDPHSISRAAEMR
jgi:hypothetical protein